MRHGSDWSRPRSTGRRSVILWLFVTALVFFVVEPSLRRGSMRDALARGGFFGLVTYATYDLTNLATLRDWPLLFTVVDMVWGMILTAATAAVSVWVVKK